MTEPGTGGRSNSQSSQTPAVLDCGQHVTSDAKTFVPHGRNAVLVVTAAKIHPPQGARVTLLEAAEADTGTPGCQCDRVLRKGGRQSISTAEPFFNEPLVPASRLPGPGLPRVRVSYSLCRDLRTRSGCSSLP
jgi:alkylation response protein AidB-like acyl-CoA dehydrogenase